MLGVGLSLTGPASRSARSGTSLGRLIESLYGNGEQGAFYVPKPQVLGQQVLFQDAAGTTPVTSDGDPVGLMLDLSGNDNHATQEVSGERPIYRTDGTRHWLEFDGVDDVMDVAIDTSGADFVFSHAIEDIPLESVTRILGGPPYSNNYLGAWSNSDTQGSNNADGYSPLTYVDGVQLEIETRLALKTAIADGEAHVVRIAPAGFTSYRVGGHSGSARMIGSLLGLIIAEAGSYMSEAEQYLANLAGVTLDD